jgi:uncharacterized protein (TIGR00730 family)
VVSTGKNIALATDDSDKKTGTRQAAPAGREQPLPWQTPKPASEDADAPERVRALLSSPSYRQADEDIEFLNRDGVRFVRLGLDYLKPELSLVEHGIAHTIVVFGSTRITEPAAARRRVAECRKSAADDPANNDACRALRRADRFLELSKYYDEARRLGQIVGGQRQQASDCQVVIMTGGGPGIMEAANRGAYDVHAKSVGLNITLPHEQYPNPYITPELCFKFHYFGLRKLHFMHRARALVAFPGGYGTIDELFDALSLIQTRKIEPIPIVLVGKEFWTRAFDINFLVDEGVIDPEDANLFSYAETADEAWEGISQWYQVNGTPLFEAAK